MSDLETFVRQQVTSAPLPAVSRVARDLSARHGNAARTALFYGSCLRDNVFEDRILDFYLLVDSYLAAHGNWVSALFNWLLPPNVYYAETLIDGQIYRSKYAVLTISQFARMCSRKTFSPYIWARFSQPSQIVDLSDGSSTDDVVSALATAVCTMLDASAPLVTGPLTPATLWPAGFNATYRTELRSEGTGKGTEIYEKNQDFYDALLPIALRELGIEAHATVPFSARTKWLWRRVQGKTLSVLKLAKATFTFVNGVDYILWKVERHSGVHVEATEWQRKHPLLASLTLTWRLWRQQAFR